MPIICKMHNRRILSKVSEYNNETTVMLRFKKLLTPQELTDETNAKTCKVFLQKNIVITDMCISLQAAYALRELLNRQLNEYEQTLNNMPTVPTPRRHKWQAERKPFERRNNDNSFYQLSAWRRASHAFRKLNPLCAMCEKEGRTTPAQMVDHIRPLSDGGAAFDHNNLQALCNQCHARKSGKEAHE